MQFPADATASSLLSRFQLTSDQVTRAEVEVILRALAYVSQKGIPGAVVELGCYTGTTSLFLQRWLQAARDTREYHVYDSFAGLPEKLPQDQSPAGFAFKAGELLASNAGFIQQFKKAGLPLPQIHKGWFESIPANAVPEPIALAFLDGDYYSSIKASLQLIEDKLAPGAVIIIDDYLSTTLPGAKKAADAWMMLKGKTCTVREGMAIIIW